MTEMKKKANSFQTYFCFSALLYALFLVPAVLWFLYAGSSDAELSRHIGGAWQAAFWQMPGLSNTVSRYILDGLEWVVIGAITWLFWQGYCCLKVDQRDDAAIQKDVIRWVGLCALILLAVIPFHSSDLYGYLNRGFQQSVFHTNPYLTPIADIPGWEQQSLLHAHWQYNPCPYGFFFAQWTRWITQLSQGHFVLAFLMMKAINVALLVGTTLLIAGLSTQLGQVRSQCHAGLSTFLFGANPLVLLHVVGNGHNDILMVFLLLLALQFLNSKSWKWLTLPVLALSVLVKYASLLAVPFVLVYLVQQRRWKVLLVGGLLSAMLTIMLALPYVDVSQPWPWAALLDNAGKSQHSIADMLGRMVYYPARWLQWGDAKVIMQNVLSVIRPLFWAGFALLCAWQGLQFVRKPQSFASLITAIALVMTVMVALVSAKFHPWYAVMFLPLVLLLPEKTWLRRFGVWFSVFQIAGFTLLQNVHIFNVLLLTLLPMWLAFKAEALPCQKLEV